MSRSDFHRRKTSNGGVHLRNILLGTLQVRYAPGRRDGNRPITRAGCVALFDEFGITGRSLVEVFRAGRSLMVGIERHYPTAKRLEMCRPTETAVRGPGYDGEYLTRKRRMDLEGVPRLEG